jgi:hypothetical protein
MTKRQLLAFARHYTLPTADDGRGARPLYTFTEDKLVALVAALRDISTPITPELTIDAELLAPTAGEAVG